MFSQDNGLYNVPIQDNFQPPMMGQQPQYMPPMNNGFYQGYSHGGSVKNMAEQVREHGRNGDTVLAHINPMEQDILKQYGGSGTINPNTGLPEYGFFKEIKKLVKGASKIAAPIIGGFFGGPAGAIAASAALGASQRGHGNHLKGALSGGMQGLGYAALAPMLGNAFGIDSGGMMGRAMGVDHPSLMGQMGFGGAAAQQPGGGLGLGSLFGGGAQGQGMATSQAPSGAEGGMFGNLSPMQMGLMGVAGLGAMKGRAKPPKEESLQDYMQRNSMKNGASPPSKNLRYKQDYAQMPEGYMGMEQGERNYFTPGEFEEIPNYSYGGHVPGSSGGQEDDFKAYLSPGEYVLRADVVSRLGDGNTNSGFKKLDLFQDSTMKTSSREGKKLPKKSPSVNKLMYSLGV